MVGKLGGHSMFAGAGALIASILFGYLYEHFSPSTAPRIWESVLRADPRDALLEHLVVPTLVLHRRDNLFAPDDVLTVARERIPHATVVELEGSDHFPFVGDVDALVAEIAAFVVGERRLPPPQRLLAAVLFTDLVGSTELLARAASLARVGSSG